MRFSRRRAPKPLFNRNELLPPEGVPLHLDVAGLGVRFGAQITDIAITGGAVIALIILLTQMSFVGGRTIWAVAAMLFFVIRIPYYVLTELAWNGQTLGKKLMKIKVVSSDGLSLSAHALVVRNLLKEAEIFLPGTLLFVLSSGGLQSWIAFFWIAGTLAVPLFDKRRRRLGDFIAGTYVIHLPQPVLLADLAQTQTRKQRFTFQAHQLDHYGAFELQTLEDLLRAQDKAVPRTEQQARSKTVATVVDKVRRKITYADRIETHENVDFLRAFYNAQRAHLEQKQLFGERRQNKHHANEANEQG